MNIQRLGRLAATGVLCLMAAAANALPIDLSGWTANTLDFSGGQPAGNWELNADNTAVTQTVNADPSFFLNNINQTSYTMQGSWKVNTNSDDDYMGFVFGYQNSSNFYLFDWKQGSQSYSGATSTEGMTIKKYEGATGDGLVDLSLGEFWENNNDLGDMTILDQNHGAGKGWSDLTEYNFFLDFNTTADTFSIVVKDGGTELWNTSVTDSTFTSGQFGFYNFSQQTVNYSGFEQEGGVVVPVPEPGIQGLILIAFFGLWAFMRRRSEGLHGC